MTSEQVGWRFEIMDCIHRYCHAVDRRLWPLMEHVFHADATYKFFSIEGSWHDFLDAAKTLIDPMGATHHQVSNIMIRFDGDTAWSETYLRAYHLVPASYPPGTLLSMEGGGTVLVGGRYIDRFERRDGVWRIAHRHGLLDWREEHETRDGGLSEMNPEWRGRLGTPDPSRLVIANFI